MTDRPSLEFTVAQGIDEYSRIKKMTGQELREAAMLVSKMLNEYAEHMSGRLALLLSDWRASLAREMEDRKEKDGSTSPRDQETPQNG